MRESQFILYENMGHTTSNGPTRTRKFSTRDNFAKACAYGTRNNTMVQINWRNANDTSVSFTSLQGFISPLELGSSVM